MTKYIRVLSDLHLEFGPFDVPATDSDHETTLILAGDIHTKDKALQHGWLSSLAARFAYVIYVLGNHEHYRSSVDVTGKKIKAGLAKLNISNVLVLENDVFEIPGTTTKIFGGTMWTDYNKFNPVTMFHASQKMNDFRYIRTAAYSRKLKPEWAGSMHNAFKKSLLAELAKEYTGNVIVVTHHAPHHLSIGANYTDDYHGSGSYRSDLSELILDHPQITNWIHGHVHDCSDYYIGDCRILANPRGYLGEQLVTGFDPLLRVKL